MNQEYSALYEKGQEALLANALSAYYNAAIRVSIEITPTSMMTPEKVRLEKAQNALEAATQSLQENPRFRQILEQFHATIVPDSIMSLTPDNSINEV